MKTTLEQARQAAQARIEELEEALRGFADRLAKAEELEWGDDFDAEVSAVVSEMRAFAKEGDRG